MHYDQFVVLRLFSRCILSCWLISYHRLLRTGATGSQFCFSTNIFCFFFFFLLSRKTLYEHNIPGVFFSLSVFLRFPCHVAYKVTSFRRLRRTAARSSQFCFVCFLFVLTPFFVVAVFPFFLLGCLLSFDPIIYRLPRIGGRRNNQSRPLAGKEG